GGHAWPPFFFARVFSSHERALSPYPLAHRLHRGQIVVQVVNRIQNLRQQFVRGIQMSKVGARIALAYAAIARWIQRALVLRIPSLLDRHSTFGSKQQSMASGARWEHAIHHVNARLRVLGDFFRSTHSHQIARPISGKMLKRGQYNVASKFPRFAHAETADGIARKPSPDGAFGRLATQFGIHSTLYYAK